MIDLSATSMSPAYVPGSTVAGGFQAQGSASPVGSAAGSARSTSKPVGAGVASSPLTGESCPAPTSHRMHPLTTPSPGPGSTPPSSTRRRSSTRQRRNSSDGALGGGAGASTAGLRPRHSRGNSDAGSDVPLLSTESPGALSANDDNGDSSGKRSPPRRSKSSLPAVRSFFATPSSPAARTLLLAAARVASLSAGSHLPSSPLHAALPSPHLFDTPMREAHSVTTYEASDL